MRISDWSSYVCSSDLRRHTSCQGARDRACNGARFLRRPTGRSTRRRPRPGRTSPSGSSSRRSERSEERRVGKECVSTCRSRVSQDHYKQKTNKEQTKSRTKKIQTK